MTVARLFSLEDKPELCHFPNIEHQFVDKITLRLEDLNGTPYSDRLL